MKRIFGALIIAHLVLISVATWAGGGELGYRSPKEINQALKGIVKRDKSSARLHSIEQTPGGREVALLELGKKDSGLPAILVVANMEGNSPPAGEAALELAELLIGEWKDELTKHTWYILPVGNPDGYARFFDQPLAKSYVNGRPFNDDNDDATDEDGPEDLNKDGYITTMRQAHPEGKWIKIEDNPVLMKRAEGTKGEQGVYRLFSEGIDNDGDGDINEDGLGGVNPGRNFPHNFRHHTKTGGRWAGSAAESRSVMRFALDHPEIALVLTFGRANTLKKVPESSRKAAAAQEKYKVPERFAKQMGVDPDTEFTLAELVEMGREFTGYKELTEDMVLQWLGVGAAVNPDKKDLPYWNEISKRYNDFIKEAELDAERLEPRGFPPGCVDEWAYYQYGVPSFSLDFWTLPVKEKKKEEKKDGAMLTPDEIEKMSNEEFIALGKEKIAAFLKASGTPAQYTADMVIMALQGGMMTTEKMAEMIRKMKKKEEAGGADETEQALYDYNPDAFVEWQSYNHPTLGEVEIGGKKPYATLAPPLADIKENIRKQLPFVRELAGLLPKITIEKIGVERKSSGVWQVNVWVANNGFLPYPSHQGQRCQRPSPAVVTLDGQSIVLLEGKKRRVVGLLDGSGGSKEVSWLVQAADGSQVSIKAFSFSAGDVEKTVTLNEGGGR